MTQTTGTLFRKFIAGFKMTRRKRKRSTRIPNRRAPKKATKKPFRIWLKVSPKACQKEAVPPSSIRARTVSTGPAKTRGLLTHAAAIAQRAIQKAMPRSRKSLFFGKPDLFIKLGLHGCDGNDRFNIGCRAST